MTAFYFNIPTNKSLRIFPVILEGLFPSSFSAFFIKAATAER